MGLTAKLSDRRWQRASAEAGDAVKSVTHKSNRIPPVRCSALLAITMESALRSYMSRFLVVVNAQLSIRLEPTPVGQAGGMTEAHAGRDSQVPRVIAQMIEILVPGLTFGLPERLVQVLLEWLVEVNYALLDQFHYQNREKCLMGVTGTAPPE
jgi:hypothetical protein